MLLPPSGQHCAVGGGRCPRDGRGLAAAPPLYTAAARGAQWIRERVGGGAGGGGGRLGLPCAGLGCHTFIHKIGFAVGVLLLLYSSAMGISVAATI